MPVQVGSVLEGKVTGITKFGAFVALEGGVTGMVHVSEISHEFVSDVSRYVSVGQTLRVKVIAVDDKGRINLSVKQLTEAPAPRPRTAPEPEAPKRIVPPEPVRKEADKNLSFEEMMARFKKTSDDRLADLSETKENRKANYNKRSRK